MKTFVIGDIHGHLRALGALLDAVPFGPDDLLLILGDYVDKGPDTKGGHSAQASGQIADLGHTICIDTGITKGKFLTCLELGSFHYWQSSPEGRIQDGHLRGNP